MRSLNNFSIAFIFFSRTCLIASGIICSSASCAMRYATSSRTASSIAGLPLCSHRFSFSFRQLIICLVFVSVYRDLGSALKMAAT